MVELKIQNYQKNIKKYQKIKNKLEKISKNNIPIHHVGSTAIPDMCGKNIIDVLIGASNNLEFLQLKEKIIKLGFFASENSKSEIYQFFASKQGETGDGDIHIHLAIINTERYDEFLILKNYLLSHKDEANSYANHKKTLIRLGITDRKKYRETKSIYVSSLIERAKINCKYKRG